MVDILVEKITNKQSRYTFSGSSLSLSWTHETRVQTVETHRYKGSYAEVAAYVDSTGANNSVIRKSDGPYYETDVIVTTNTAWVVDAQSS